MTKTGRFAGQNGQLLRNEVENHLLSRVTSKQGGRVALALDLEQHHRELVGAIDNMNCGVIGIDRDNVIVFANDCLLGWLGYTWDEFVGESVFKIIPKELDQQALQQLAAIGGGNIRARITIAQRKDSTTFPVLLIPHQYAGSEGPFFNVVVELSTIQTAQPIEDSRGQTLRGNLDRIAHELQMIGLLAGADAAPTIPIGHPEIEQLTEREREVLTHLVSGMRVPAIANTLHISPHTVRNHLKSIFRQCGVGNQSELIEHVRSLGARAS
jgi:PAS domain S-box-containing protein